MHGPLQYCFLPTLPYCMSKVSIVFSLFLVGAKSIDLVLPSQNQIIMIYIILVNGPTYGKWDLTQILVRKRRKSFLTVTAHPQLHLFNIVEWNKPDMFAGLTFFKNSILNFIRPTANNIFVTRLRHGVSHLLEYMYTNLQSTLYLWVWRWKYMHIFFFSALI